MEKALFLFMMFSIVGWLWETPWVSFRQKKFVNRGFLRGPYIPIYGFAVMTIVFTMGIFNDIENQNGLIILVEMIYMGIITAIWEFCTSWGLEKVFHTRWWDYSTHKYNIQGRISLGVTLFFAIGGYILWRFVLPPFEWVYAEIPPNYMIIILCVFYTVYTVDGITTLNELFKIRNVISKINNYTAQLGERVEVTYSNIKDEVLERKTSLQESILEVKDYLEKRYSDLPDDSLTKKVSTEFLNLNETYTSSKKVNRFYKKYPNSYSVEILSIRKLLGKIKNRIGKDKM